MEQQDEQVRDEMTSERALLEQRLEEVEEEGERVEVLRAALTYRSSWLGLAEHLSDVAETRQFKEWGFKTFKDYCEEELRLPQTIVRKLVRGYQWIDRELPNLLAGLDAAQSAEAPVIVPDVDTVGALIAAEREVERERIERNVYDTIKAQAVRGEANARVVRAEVKEAIPEHLREDPNGDPVKVLKRTLSSAEKMLEQLEIVVEGDEETLELAMRLRDRVFELLAARTRAETSEAPPAPPAETPAETSPEQSLL